MEALVLYELLPLYTTPAQSCASFLPYLDKRGMSSLPEFPGDRPSCLLGAFELSVRIECSGSSPSKVILIIQFKENVKLKKCSRFLNELPNA